MQAWSPYLNKDQLKVEMVQKRAVKMIRNLRATSYDNRLEELNLFSLKKRRLRGDLIEVFKIMKGLSKWDHSLKLKSAMHNIRGHSMKLDKQFNRTDIRKHFFTQRVVDEWNKLPQKAIECRSVDTFKKVVDAHLNNINIF